MNKMLGAGLGLGAIAILAGVGVLIWSALAHTIHPSGDIGYGDIAVGIGTLMLAIVTFGSVALSWQALRDGAAATDLAAREIEQAQRPVVVPVMEYQPDVPAAVAGLGGPRRDERGFLVIPVQNIGVGPAINGKLEVLRTGATSGHFDDGEVSFLGLGPAQRQDVPVSRHRLLGDGMTTFGLRLTYADVAGKQWVTVARYSASSNTYADMRVGAAGDVNEDVLVYFGTSSAQSAIPTSDE